MTLYFWKTFVSNEKIKSFADSIKKTQNLYENNKYIDGCSKENQNDDNETDNLYHRLHCGTLLRVDELHHEQEEETQVVQNPNGLGHHLRDEGESGENSSAFAQIESHVCDENAHTQEEERLDSESDEDGDHQEHQIVQISILVGFFFLFFFGDLFGVPFPTFLVLCFVLFAICLAVSEDSDHEEREQTANDHRTVEFAHCVGFAHLEGDRHKGDHEEGQDHDDLVGELLEEGVERNVEELVLFLQQAFHNHFENSELENQKSEKQQRFEVVVQKVGSESEFSEPIVLVHSVGHFLQVLHVGEVHVDFLVENTVQQLRKRSSLEENHCDVHQKYLSETRQCPDEEEQVQQTEVEESNDSQNEVRNRRQVHEEESIDHCL